MAIVSPQATKGSCYGVRVGLGLGSMAPLPKVGALVAVLPSPSFVCAYAQEDGLQKENGLQMSKHVA